MGNAHPTIANSYVKRSLIVKQFASIAPFTFIDLFAGIGGFRLAMENLGGQCLFSSEWDKYCQKTYQENFCEIPYGDLTSQEVKNSIPENFDILCAGFPCQAFSIAGRKLGFEDARGTLFFELALILKKHRPLGFILENVKGLAHHDKGKTLKVILNTLREDLGYDVPHPKIINAKNFGLPQNRERIFIVGFRKDLNVSYFEYPSPISEEKQITIQDILEEKEVSVKYYLSTQYIKVLENHKNYHQSKGNGFGYNILSPDDIAGALVLGGMGRERNLIIDKRLTNFTPVTRIKGEVNKQGIRRLTPREYARLQGFPDDFKIVVSDTQAYKQFANSVPVPVVEAVGNKVIQKLSRTKVVA
ncbi:DNA-cytosine methyltransferase [Halothece sp. PCC 7418]|nr:DNA-cytosine methyltransferase [Halothece sp. PCC 7418]